MRTERNEKWLCSWERENGIAKGAGVFRNGVRERGGDETGRFFFFSGKDANCDCYGKGSFFPVRFLTSGGGGGAF